MSEGILTRTTRTRALGATLIVLAGFLANAAVYDLLIVPRLPGWHAVPAEWWVLSEIPLLLCLVGAGFFPQSQREVIIASAMAGTLLTFLGAVAAELHLPGTAKSLYFEAPEAYWISSPVIYFVLVAVPLSIVHGIRRAWRMSRARVAG